MLKEGPDLEWNMGQKVPDVIIKLGNTPMGDMVVCKALEYYATITKTHSIDSLSGITASFVDMVQLKNIITVHRLCANQIII